MTGGPRNGPADAWRSVRDDPDIQFEPVARTETEPPAWLEAVFEFLQWVFGPIARGFVVVWPVLQWVLIAIGVILLVLLAARILGLSSGRRDAPEDGDRDFAPEREDAIALLDDADRLADEGRFTEAVRLLLARSIGQIGRHRPDLVQPSSTARELAGLEALPEKARTAFAAIARSVERGIFALEDLTESDWREARGAYADFALERG